MPSERGFSLLELTLIVAFLGFLAAVLIPAAAPYQEPKLDLVASALADAIRFARADAIRVGQYRAVKINKDTGQITVGSPLIMAGEVSGFQSIAYNPADKKLYDFALSAVAQEVGARINQSDPPFLFKNLTGARDTCLFDAEGNPLWLAAGSSYGLTAGSVKLEQGSTSRQVLVSMVGRVTVQ